MPMEEVVAVVRPKGLQCSAVVLMAVGAGVVCLSVRRPAVLPPSVSVRWRRAKPLRAGISSRRR